MPPTIMPEVLCAVFLVALNLFSGCLCEEIKCPGETCSCSIDRNNSSGLQFLTHCANASLTDIPKELNTNTTILDVSDNNITQLRNSTFERLVHLDKVFVNRNYISTVESGTFRKLASLSELHLESNVLASILPGTFDGNSELVVLNLRGNRLSSLPVDVITLNNHIQELDLGDNNIKKLDTYVVQKYYPALRRLDVSKNRISHLFSTSEVDNSSLEVIDASYNYITKIDPNSFSSTTNLKDLNVSNNKLSNLGEDVFNNNPNLVRLDISRNHILTIHRNAFRNNPQLTEILAGSNKMTFIHQDTFSQNPEITKVTLSWNDIQKFHPQTFDNNPNLETVDVNGNKIKTLDSGIFQNNPKLKSVDLSSNSLITLHESTFRNNPKLEHLFMSKNEHVRFHSGLLIRATTLKVFDAQHCNLSQLPADLFNKNVDLRELKLANNNFTSLKEIANKNYVDMLTKLEILDVSNNRLQTINVEVFTNNMTDLKALHIEGNPFVCDCKLRNAWIWSRKVGIIPSQPQIYCIDAQQRSVEWDNVQRLNCNDEFPIETTQPTPLEETTRDYPSTVSANIHRVKSNEPISTVELHRQPIQRDEERSNKIMVGVSLFLLLAVVLVILPLLFIMRRRYGTYRVSKSMRPENNTTSAGETPSV